MSQELKAKSFMIPVLLIAGNLLREQRMPVVFLALWSAVIAAAFSFGEEKLIQDDFVFVLGQQALYAVGFSAFVATFSVHNERRSRRILSVLSRAIERRTYLAGILLGVALCFSFYCIAISASSLWITRSLGYHPMDFARLAVVLMAACLLTAAIGLFFATFLDPLPATAATALLIAVPGLPAALLGGFWMHTIPVYSLSSSVMRFSFDSGWMPSWAILAWAVVEALGFWIAASWIFERRDIAVAVE